jgi:5-methylcytosine-specific restriction protein A
VTYGEQMRGLECSCGCRSNLFVIVYAVPLYERWWSREDQGELKGWSYRVRARCIDRARCEARLAKAKRKREQRSALLVVAEPQFPNAPRGQCRWCGAMLVGDAPRRRNYCYPEHEGRNCRREAWRSRAWTARQAIEYRGDPVCGICGSDNPRWEADHIVPLEDGGEHTMENLQRACDPCHHAKTAAENAARARQRAPAADENQATLFAPDSGVRSAS